MTAKTMPTKVNKIGEAYIQFKCPGFVNADTDKKNDNVVKKIVKLIDSKSVEFTGVNASKFISPSFHGNFSLYTRKFFKGTDGKTYSITGVDTENWKGFSIKITCLNDSNSKLVEDHISESGSTVIPDITYDKYGFRVTDEEDEEWIE